MIKDIHCHLLYGVDDGAKDRDESLRMLDVACRGGIGHIVATPHYRGRWNNRQKVNEVYADLTLEAKQRGIILTLGSELFIREFESDKIGFIKNELCFKNSNTVLLELALNTNLDEAQDVIYPLQRHGMDVIIAHPERNAHIQNNEKMFDEYIIMGCELQLSAECLALPLWNIRKRTANRILRAKGYSYYASDAHSVHDYEVFFEVVNKYNLT